MSISRRGALLGATAAVAVAGVPTAVQADDTGLLAQIEQFNDLYRRSTRLWQKQKAHRAEIEAMPDCPGPKTWPMGGYGHARDAFLEARDGYRYYDKANELWDQTGAAVNTIFETPAQTATGVLEKVRILYITRGDYDDADNGDTDLEAHQNDTKSPWFGSVIADLERLARGLPS